jgi:hypothetical protein
MAARSAESRYLSIFVIFLSIYIQCHRGTGCKFIQLFANFVRFIIKMNNYGVDFRHWKCID